MYYIIPDQICYNMVFDICTYNLVQFVMTKINTIVFMYIYFLHFGIMHARAALCSIKNPLVKYGRQLITGT
jgi:hypothetical protein